MEPTSEIPAFSPRPACSDDIEQILVIEHASYPEPWSADHFVTEMQKPYSKTLVLTDDETDTTVIGYIIYWVQAEGASLLNVAVHPKWRGLGFARKLIQEMIKEVVRDDISKIVLEVRESNQDAISLYEKIGFKRTHRRDKFYSNGEAAFVYEIKTSDASNVIQ